MRYNYRCFIGITTFLTFSIILTNVEGEVLTDKKIIETIPHQKKEKKNNTNNSELDISSDEIVLNSESKTTTAIGDVKIKYNGYHMSARKITLDHKNHRIIASGNIKLVAPNQHKIYAEYLDVTDNFENGIIKNLTIDMPNKTYLTASSAKVINGQNTIFDQGTYTACSSCANQKKSPLFWMVKSKRIILNRQTHTIRLEKIYLEIFENSVIYLPFIEIPDETVKRKTGFLTPVFSSGANQKFGFGIPYYIVISDSSDATFTISPYPKKGILSEIELRKYFYNGKHTLHAAYMYNAFNINKDFPEPRHQAMISSTAVFQINPIWHFGWNLTAQTPHLISSIYNEDPLSERIKTNEVYLEGSGEKHKLDVRALHYYIQEPLHLQEKKFPQANIYPLIDYYYVNSKNSKDNKISITGNITAISRIKEENIPNTIQYNQQLWIPYGSNRRLSIKADWRRNFIGPSGILFTPLANIKGDLHYLSFEKDNFNHIKRNDQNIIARKMLTAGLDIRYPIVAISKRSRHVLEGIAQMYAATDEEYIKEIPNEDSQSLVLSSANLFSQNRFSGFDRTEGGTRANLGIRYTGNFNNLFTVHGVIGQSIHILGTNSLSIPDSIGIEQNSGLEDKFSDYVGAIKISLPSNIMFSTQNLINTKDWSIRRTDTNVQYTMSSFSSNISYTHIPKHPLYSYNYTRDIIQSDIRFKINDSFSANASLKWDINDRDTVPYHSLGLSYQNDCATFKIYYNNKSSSKIDAYKITASLSLRTIGEISTSSLFDEY
ncbi:LPS-assembly protein LptD [Candidatus Liberibacter brunswickensis]|uniref:LPS-assembly protein LptD n=1 Tax=Candidatus Liberibacter brunswickensis TaxID=1968796 RepID=UPI002FE141D4